MWKWLKETILAVVVVVLTTAGAAAAAPSLSDGAHLLTPAEQAEVTAVLQDTEVRYGVRVAVVTVPRRRVSRPGLMPISSWTGTIRTARTAIWSCSWPWTAMTGMSRRIRP